MALNFQFPTSILEKRDAARIARTGYLCFSFLTAFLMYAATRECATLVFSPYFFIKRRSSLALYGNNILNFYKKKRENTATAQLLRTSDLHFNF